MNKNWLPILLTIIDVIQAIICITCKNHDIPRFLYWLSAAVLTLSTIYMR